MTVTDSYASPTAWKARKERMDDMRAVIDALSDPTIPLPYELDQYGFSIQVRDAQHRCQIEGALVGYGFSFGEDTVWTDSAGVAQVWRPILRCERQVGKLYGPQEWFRSTPELLDELVDDPKPLSDQAAAALLDALKGEAAVWERVPVGEYEDVTGEVVPTCADFMRVPSGWRARTYVGGVREYVEPER